MSDTSPELLAAFDAFCPGIVGNRFIPHWPHPKQALLLASCARGNKDGTPYEALYGGAAGGGKSDALLMAAAQYVHMPNYRGMLIRQTYAELTRAGALMDRAMKWWLPIKGVKWSGDEKRFTFPSGATIEFGYHSHPTDDAKFHGGEWHFIGFDELTNWDKPSAFEWVRSRIRKNEGDPIPLRIIGTANPGGPGHDWVKERFIDPGEKRKGVFFPATINDNPSLDREAYIRTLDSMHPTRRAQLLNGDWDARDPGDYFRREWFGPLLDGELWPAADAIRVRWWDLAASEKETAARTASVRMARHRSGVRAIEHAMAFRKSPGPRDEIILQTAQADGHSVTVGIEIEPGSGGIAQFLALEGRLKAKGFRVVGARPGSDMEGDEALLIARGTSNMAGKAGRAAPVASCLERGFQRRGDPGSDPSSSFYGLDAKLPVTLQRDGLRIYAGPWTTEYLSEVEGFPNGATCDLVDATSGAWNYLETRASAFRKPPEMPTRAPIAEQENVHPEDRDRPNTRRKWAPP